MPPGEEPNPFISIAEQWLKSWQLANELSQENLARMELFWDPKQRGLWFADLSRILDNYMRSPEFLGLMQRSLRTLTGTTALSSLQPDRRVSDGDHTTPLP